MGASEVWPNTGAVNGNLVYCSPTDACACTGSPHLLTALLSDASKLRQH